MKVGDRVVVVSGYEWDSKLCAGNTGTVSEVLTKGTPTLNGKIVYSVVMDNGYYIRGGWAYYEHELEEIQ